MSHKSSKRDFATFTEANGSSASTDKARISDPALWDAIFALPTETTQDLLYRIGLKVPTVSALVS
jgi:hypothetical protein